jgi:transposase
MTTLVSNTTLRPSTTLKPPRTDGAIPAAPASLAETVRVAARQLDEAAFRRVAAPDAGLAFQPKALLALLSYCYARGIYGSEAIEDAMRRDGEFRRLCGGEFPDARVLRRFRRENRWAVQQCLLAALTFLAERKVREGAITKIDPEHLAEEASRRITSAMFIDRMELDEV